MTMAETEFTEKDRRQAVAQIGQPFRGLHDDNVMRYRLRPEDLAGIERGRGA